MIALLNVVFPYAVAFKIVTVLGTVTLPAAAWGFGKLAGFRRPVPVLMAAAMLPYLFNTSYTIDGGNLTSTLAGEFSFSLALTTGMLFLGVFAYALRTGRLRGLAALLFAVTVLCHVVPALAFAGVAVVLALSRTRLSAFRVLVPVGVVGGLLAAFWLLPFGADLQYSSSMGYLRIPGILDNLVPTGCIFMVVPAAIGALIALLRRDRFAIVLALGGVGAGAAFAELPSGLVYNGRWLPFWFLFVALLARRSRRAIEGDRLASRTAQLGIPDGDPRRHRRLLGGRRHRRRLDGGFSFRLAQLESDPGPGMGQLELHGLPREVRLAAVPGDVRDDGPGSRTLRLGRLKYEYIKETNLPFGSTEAMMSLPSGPRAAYKTPTASTSSLRPRRRSTS